MTWISIVREDGTILSLSRSEAYAITRSHLNASVLADAKTPPSIPKCSGQKGCVSCVQAKKTNPKSFE